jgi:hypothetical protein
MATMSSTPRSRETARSLRGRDTRSSFRDDAGVDAVTLDLPLGRASRSAPLSPRGSRRVRGRPLASAGHGHRGQGSSFGPPPGRNGSDGGPRDHAVGVRSGSSLRRGSAVEPGQNRVDDLLRGRVDVARDGGEGWGRQGRRGDVVHTDHGQVSRDGDVDLPSAREDGESDLVVEAADPGDGGLLVPPASDGGRASRSGEWDRRHQRFG